MMLSELYLHKDFSSPASNEKPDFMSLSDNQSLPWLRNSFLISGTSTTASEARCLNSLEALLKNHELIKKRLDRFLDENGDVNIEKLLDLLCTVDLQYSIDELDRLSSAEQRYYGEMWYEEGCIEYVMAYIADKVGEAYPTDYSQGIFNLFDNRARAIKNIINALKEFDPRSLQKCPPLTEREQSEILPKLRQAVKDYRGVDSKINLDETAAPSLIPFPMPAGVNLNGLSSLLELINSFLRRAPALRLVR
jgi:hypothetical protein